MFLNSNFVVNKIILHSKEPQRKALVFRFIVLYLPSVSGYLKSLYNYIDCRSW